MKTIEKKVFKSDKDGPDIFADMIPLENGVYEGHDKCGFYAGFVVVVDGGVYTGSPEYPEMDYRAGKEGLEEKAGTILAGYFEERRAEHYRLTALLSD